MEEKAKEFHVMHILKRTMCCAKGVYCKGKS
jgi:hypothetical protein